MLMDELTRLVRNAERSVFRLETLRSYAAPGEAALLRDFREGRPLPPRTPNTDPWLCMVAAGVRAGRSWSRVHVLHRPLSEYLQFELLGYQGNVEAGEDVRIADRGAHPGALDHLSQDFWIVDDEIVIVVRYDEIGRRLGMEATTDVEPFIAVRQLALELSVPLSDYLHLVHAELPRSW